MPNKTGGYGIKAVTRLTGLPAHTLRLWEERYGALQVPRSAGGHRVYSAANLERLHRLKRLVAQGHRISDLAGLPDSTLDARLSRDAKPSEDLTAPQRAAVFGPTLPNAMRDAGLAGHLQVADHEWARFKQACVAIQPDALLLELPELTAATVDEVRELVQACPAASCVATFFFSRRADIAALHDAGIQTLQAPAAATDLWWLVQSPTRPASPAGGPPTDLPPSGGTEPPAPHRFSPAQLAALATHSSAVACECPAHLVQLVQSLNAFESYSANCEHTSPDDAALHALLHRETARARAIMETALAQLAEAEGIEYD